MREAFLLLGFLAFVLLALTIALFASTPEGLAKLALPFLFPSPFATLTRSTLPFILRALCPILEFPLFVLALRVIL